MDNKKRGEKGEKAAASYLESKGLKILHRNYTCKLGEIDIILEDDGVIVFVEVKYRHNLSKGRPLEAVNYYKQRKIQNTALWYAKEYSLFEKAIRFDVIEVLGQSENITWIKEAFWINNNSRFL